MAKKKNEKAEKKSPFMPVEEQPYQVPGNWRWTVLGQLVEIKRGASPRPIKKYITDCESGINWIKIGDADGTKYISNIKEKITEEGARKSVFVEKGTLLLSNSMSFGHPYILNVSGCIHDGWLALKPSKYFDKEYLYYALLSSDWYFEQVAVGTAVRNLNSDRVARTPVPLPSLAEQQRIVDRVESLFVKLDEAKEKTQEVLESFDIRKAAILRKAFDGELTGTFSSFPKHNKALADVCFSIYDGDHMPPPKSDTGIAFLVISDVNTGHLVFEKARFVPEDYYNSLTDTRKPQAGDVLYTLVGSYGIAVLVDSDRPFCFQRHMALLKPISEEIISQYLWYILQSNDVHEQATDIATGTAQLTVPIKGLRKLRISVPDLEEQKEIVRILDDFFAKEAEAKEKVETTLEAIDTMKKSILAKAFRGELGTNNPEDENAEELLKRTLA